MANASVENILITPLATLMGGNAINEQNCVDITINYNLTGGSFSISLLDGALAQLPGENAAITLPFGRVGIVRSSGGGASTGGLLETISGPAVPLASVLVNFFGILPGKNQQISQVATALASPAFLSWQTLDVPIKNFSYRGLSLAGIQQLASFLLAEVIVNNGFTVVDPGVAIGSTFTIPKSDIVSASQFVDYSLDIAARLNPALSTAQLDDQGDFVYDSEHAQKQPKFTVQAGAPGSQGSSDFIPIPDGWLVDGNFEEWTPPSNTDFTNPSPSVPSGRYWKVFQSPTNPGMLRGITSFTRLVKQINIPGNVSTFVGSPITGLTKQGTTREFAFDNSGTESGIYGFNALDTIMSDVISGKTFEFANAIVLTPTGSVDSGDASSNFYSITMELWTFPRVNPTVFPVGNPVNPFNLPSNIVVVNPNSNVVNTGSGLSQYYNRYLQNYRRINSPRLKTNVTCVFRNTLPQVGGGLVVPSGLKISPNCGRIQSVSLRFGRAGIVLNISAELYQFGGGLYQQGG